MIMKKKYIATTVTLVLLAGAGTLYSCAGSPGNLTANLSASLPENSSENIPAVSISQSAPENCADNNDAEDAGSGHDGTGIRDDEAGSNKYIYVHICGAVNEPGVYKISSGSRFVDAIGLAGGLTEDAAGDSINQAKELRDGERLYVPTEEEVKESGEGQYLYNQTPVSESAGESMGLVNINSACLEELISLPGIGRSRAESIISYRSENGGFKSAEEIMNIPGIKEGLYKQLSPYITVD
jgi:competence protein ComEA